MKVGIRVLGLLTTSCKESICCEIVNELERCGEKVYKVGMLDKMYDVNKCGRSGRW